MITLGWGEGLGDRSRSRLNTSSVVYRINAHFLVSRTQEHVTSQGEGDFVDGNESNPEMEGLSWITRVGLMSSQAPRERDAGGSEPQELCRRAESDVVANEPRMQAASRRSHPRGHSMVRLQSSEMVRNRSVLFQA